jgi:5-methylthioadenosine/S-adenosylhomocysteine deaminase
MNARREVRLGDLRMKNGFIVEIGADLKSEPGEQLVDASECFVIPGLIQVHTHLVQTLFRGLADDLELLDWLKEKIWPMENAHDEHSIRASAQIGLLEMQLSGTTSILDMGTVRLHEVVFGEAERSGMRYWGGNCLMDLKSMSGPLYREREESLEYSRRLIKEWHKKTPLLQYAISPRFAISCSDKILKECAKIKSEHDLVFHTHASENKSEVALVKKRTGLPNVQFLKKMGVLTKKSVIAHGIHLNNAEINDMVKLEAGLAHCPSSNLKLASGIAKIQSYRKKGMKIGLGSDGAPCNNTMDAFMEMRLAALLQKPLFGPTALPAQEAFELATLGGAQVLNAEDKIGSLEVGKRADVVVVRRDHPSVSTVIDPYSALVYSCNGRDVRDVWIEGKLAVRDGRHQVYDAATVTRDANDRLRELINRLPKATGKYNKSKSSSAT